jgi:hypothetical protein
MDGEAITVAGVRFGAGREAPGFLTLPGGGRVPVLLVSLADAADRRAVLLQRGVPTDWVEAWFPAADMRGADRARMEAEADLAEMEAGAGRPIRAGEIGCSMSHRNLGRWLAASGHDMALVLEDDILPQGADWLARVAALAQALSGHAARGTSFICLLGARPGQTRHAISRPVAWTGGVPPVDVPGLRLHWDDIAKVWRSHAYLISRAAVRRSSAAEAKILTLTDDWVERRRRGWLDEILFTDPVLIAQDEDAPSSIGGREAIGARAAAVPPPTGLAVRIRRRRRMLSAWLSARRPYRIRLAPPPR